MSIEKNDGDVATAYQLPAFFYVYRGHCLMLIPYVYLHKNDYRVFAGTQQAKSLNGL